MAFQTPQLEVLGLTTIFGNVTTEDATRNALILGEIAGYPDVPVAEGSPEPLKGGTPDIAYFIHGSDRLGNTNLPPPKSKKIEKTASEFLVDMVSEYPGQVSILALGPLTNLALAIKKDSSFASKSKGRHAQLLSTMCTCYRDWHVESLGVYGFFLHDPVSFVALMRPDLFTYKKGVVRVRTEGIYMGTPPKKTRQPVKLCALGPLSKSRCRQGSIMTKEEEGSAEVNHRSRLLHPWLTDLLVRRRWPDQLLLPVPESHPISVRPAA
ncbi:hypothetical protein ACSBR2_004189 [Camellia fascicularis]